MFSPWELISAKKNSLVCATHLSAPKCLLIPDSYIPDRLRQPVGIACRWCSRAESSSPLPLISFSKVYHSLLVCISSASPPLLLHLLWFRLTLSISRTPWMSSKSQVHLLPLLSPLLNYEDLSTLVNPQHHALGSPHHVNGVCTQDDTYWLYVHTFQIYHL